MHDCYSSIGVTLGTLAKVLCGSRYTYLDRAGSLARFAVRRPSWRDRMRVVHEMPWFARNVVLKVLLRLRLRPRPASSATTAPTTRTDAFEPVIGRTRFAMLHAL